MQEFRSATTEDDIVALAVCYRRSFPESEVSTETLLRHMLSGGAIDWGSGALYNPKMSKPAPEQNIGQEDADEHIYAQSVSAGELIDAGIGFSMREEESPFVEEFVEDNGFKVALHGELKGVNTKTSVDLETGILEPFTEVEVINFVAKVFVTPRKEQSIREWWDVAVELIEQRNASLLDKYNTKKARLQHLLREAVEEFEEQLHQASQQQDFSLHNINPFEWRRARASERRYNIGGQWSQESRWFIGEREGITHGREELNDKIYSRLDQDQLPGEYTDGVGLLHEEENYEALDRSALHFARTGRVRTGAIFQSCYTHNKKVTDPQTGRNALVYVQAADGGPVNRGWTERSIYLLRQEMKRGELFAEKLWRVLTWPLPVVVQGMKAVETQYISSVKECAPGPGRKSSRFLTPREKTDIVKLGWFREGEWHNVPLYGQKAIQWLKGKNNLGNLKGHYVHKDIRVVLGESWHKTTLRREHIEALRDALQWRKQNEAYEGLPLSYVANKYR